MCASAAVEGILTDPHDFGAFADGEVLVAHATTPAWTPLFARAAAVVTDGGTLAAHASLVAREYGIPAVVGTGDATRRLRPGQRVTSTAPPAPSPCTTRPDGRPAHIARPRTPTPT
jgi:phosphoenolpyruvate synthase/pyruvate phosphate dikinase